MRVWVPRRERVSVRVGVEEGYTGVKTNMQHSCEAVFSTQRKYCRCNKSAV
jgi:hypothetical protein